MRLKYLILPSMVVTNFDVFLKEVERLARVVPGAFDYALGQAIIGGASDDQIIKLLSQGAKVNIGHLLLLTTHDNI